MIYICLLIVGIVVLFISRTDVWGQESERVYVRSFDGAYINSVLRVPTGKGPRPAIMFIHGGVGGATQQTGPPDFVQGHFLADGYVVFEVDYRCYHFGDEELEDVVACYRYLKTRPEVDPSRVGVIGGSHGGYLALMLATRERPSAMTIFAGLVDIEGVFYDKARQISAESYGNFELLEKRYHQGLSIREESDLMTKGKIGPPSRKLGPGAGIKDVASRWGENADTYRLYSPMSQYPLIECPVLFIVGSEDEFKVAGKALIDHLQSLDRVAEYLELPDVGHAFYWGHRPDMNGNMPEAFYVSLKRTTDFMKSWV